MRLIKPYDSKVVIMPDKSGAETRASGIILTDVRKAAPTSGVILEVGPDCDDIRVGQHVVFKAYDAQEVEYDDKLVLIIERSDLLGHFDEDE